MWALLQTGELQEPDEQVIKFTTCLQYSQTTTLVLHFLIEKVRYNFEHNLNVQWRKFWFHTFVYQLTTSQKTTHNSSERDINPYFGRCLVRYLPIYFSQFTLQGGYPVLKVWTTLISTCPILGLINHKSIYIIHICVITNSNEHLLTLFMYNIAYSIVWIR